MFQKFLALIALTTLIGLSAMPAASANFDEFFTTEEEPVEEYYIDSFVISAYYSPLEGQSHYVTGSLAGDIRLNGRGTNGADGTPVYPGMIAAPSKYPFGTKLVIPGIGTTTIHDRGGAIVSTDNHETRGYSHDRLDVWMGHGDEGLRRALNWGKRTVTGVKVYGVRPDIEDSVYLEGFSAAEVFVNQTVLSPLEFPRDIYMGDDGEEVSKMQQYLVDWLYLDEVTGFYGEETAQAIFDFQLDFVDSVTEPEDLGAGHFGINTRKAFDKLINNKDFAEEALRLQKGSVLMNKYTDLFDARGSFNRALEFGDSGEDVTKLQEELQKLGFLRVDPSGYYGETTQHAVYKFQQSQGIVASVEDLGAGYLGPRTRAQLNKIIESRYETKSMLAYNREQVSTGKHIVKYLMPAVAKIEEEIALGKR